MNRSKQSKAIEMGVAVPRRKLSKEEKSMRVGQLMFEARVTPRLGEKPLDIFIGGKDVLNG